MELDGAAAVEGIGEVIVTLQLCAVGVDDPGPGGHDILVGLVAPLGIAAQNAVHIVAGAVAGVEVGDEGGRGDGGLVREQTGHTGPVGDGGIGDIDGGVTGILHGVGVEGTLDLMELGAVGGQTQGGVGAVQSQGELGQTVLVHQQMVREPGVHAVLLHVDAGEGVELAAIDGLHGGDGGGDLGGGPVIVHEELIHAPDAVGVVSHPELVGLVDAVAVADTAGLNHGVVPGDQHVGTLGVHVVDHLVQPGCHFGGAAVGLLVEEVAVEAIVVHDFDHLVGNGEGAVGGLLAEVTDLLHIAGAGAPGEAQGGDHGNAVGMGSVDELTGGHNNETLLGAGPVDEGVHILPVVEGVAQERFGSLGTGVVMVGVSQGAEHQLCLGVGQGVDHKTAHALLQRNAGAAVSGIGVGFNGPLQQGVGAEGRANGHQGSLGFIVLVHGGGAILARSTGEGDGRQQANHHDECQRHGDDAAGQTNLHVCYLLVFFRDIRRGIRSMRNRLLYTKNRIHFVHFRQFHPFAYAVSYSF